MALKLKMDFPKTMKIELNFAYLDEVTLIPGDNVWVNEESDPEAIAKIEKLIFDCTTGKVIVKVQWYYKAKDITDKEVKKVSSDIEVFLSDSFMEIELSCVDGKVRILGLEDIITLDSIDDDVFFSRAKWNSTTGKVVPGLEQWEKHCLCQRVINPDLPFLVCAGCQRIFHEKCLKDKGVECCNGCGGEL